MEGKKDEYILSLKDMCGIKALDKLRDAGVYSLKIEGRMKQLEYACGVVKYYRSYIDSMKPVSDADYDRIKVTWKPLWFHRQVLFRPQWL